MTGTESVELNLVEFFRHFARCRQSGEVADLDGISIASSGIEFHMFNAAFFSRPVTAADGDLERRIDLAAGHLGGQGRRWAFWASEDSLKHVPRRQVQAAFERQSLRIVYRHPGMINECLPAPTQPPPGLEIRRVVDRQDRLALSHINSVAFRLPLDWCLELYDIDNLWSGGFAGYVGYVNGEAVSTAATLIAADAVGVYAVATLPGRERKGYAEAMTRYAVARAREESGIRRSILQATTPGLPLYRRMGYQVVTHFAVFS